jgi:tRNA G18 (ribose-2'-O)-methylase SpoU
MSETETVDHNDFNQSLIAEYRAKGWQTAAVETTPHAVDVFEWTPRFPVLLLFGNEVDGLSAPVLEASDVHVRIPMLGVKESLNVAVAGGVLLFELLRKFRETAENRGSAEFAAQAGGRR